MDGFEVERTIRSASLAIVPKIVFLSSMGLCHDLEDQEVIARNTYLTKPVKQSLLLETITSVLNDQSASIEAVTTKPSETEEDVRLDSKHILLSRIIQSIRKSPWVC
jgi:CheY-like chemotaxis protein